MDDNGGISDVYRHIGNAEDFQGIETNMDDVIDFVTGYTSLNRDAIVAAMNFKYRERHYFDVVYNKPVAFGYDPRFDFTIAPTHFKILLLALDNGMSVDDIVTLVDSHDPENWGGVVNPLGCIAPAPIIQQEGNYDVYNENVNKEEFARPVMTIGQKEKLAAVLYDSIPSHMGVLYSKGAVELLKPSPKLVRVGKDAFTLYSDSELTDSGRSEHWMIITRRLHLPGMDGVFKYDFPFATVFSSDAITFTDSMGIKDEFISKINLHVVARFDNVCFVGDKAIKVKRWYDILDPHNIKKRYVNVPPPGVSGILYVVDRFLQKGVKLREQDAVYNLSFNTEMTETVLNKMLPFMGNVQPTFLQRLGFKDSARVNVVVQAECIAERYVLTDMEVGMWYLIPGFSITQFVLEPGFAGMLNALHYERFDARYELVKCEYRGKLVYRYYLGSTARTGISNVKSHVTVDEGSALVLGDIANVRLPKVFSTSHMGVEFSKEARDVGNFSVFADFLTRNVGAVYNGEYDVWYNPDGISSMLGSDMHYFQALVDTMDMSFANFIHMLFEVDVDLNMDFSVNVRKFDGKYRAVCYESGDYLIMGAEAAQKSFTKYFMFAGKYCVPGMQSPLDLPLLKKRQGKWYPTYIYMMM